MLILNLKMLVFRMSIMVFGHSHSIYAEVNHRFAKRGDMDPEHAKFEIKNQDGISSFFYKEN